MDLNTKTGMAEAVEWLNQTTDRIKEGGVWFIPRSGTSVQLLHSKKEAVITPGFAADPSIEWVLDAAGWAITTEGVVS